MFRNSRLGVPEILETCANENRCLSVEHKLNVRANFNNITRLEAANDWTHATNFKYYDVFYATQGTFNVNENGKFIIYICLLVWSLEITKLIDVIKFRKSVKSYWNRNKIVMMLCVDPTTLQQRYSQCTMPLIS